MEQKKDLVCTFYHHSTKQINRACLNIVCRDKTRKVCDSCLTEKHQDHQKDCFTLKQIIEIVKNQQWLFQQFLANLASNSLPVELMSKFKNLERDIELALKGFEKSDYQEDAIKLAVRCYNERIQEEIKYLMYEESEINEQYSHLRKNHFVILEKLYEQVNEDFMISNFIYRGDNLQIKLIQNSLSSGQNWSQALNYYDQALEMTTNPDHQFFIQKKKCKNKINTLDDILYNQNDFNYCSRQLDFKCIRFRIKGTSTQGVSPNNQNINTESTIIFSLPINLKSYLHISQGVLTCISISHNLTSFGIFYVVFTDTLIIQYYVKLFCQKINYLIKRHMNYQRQQVVKIPPYN